MSNDLVQAMTLHGRCLYRIAWRILGHVEEVDDVLQDVVLEAIKVSRRETVASWVGLLKRLTVCRSLDRLRKRRPVEEFFETDFSDSGADSTVEKAIARELEIRLRDALLLLPPRQAQVFSLRYFDDCGTAEIANALGISAAAVATALRKSRVKLAELLSIHERKS